MAIQCNIRKAAAIHKGSDGQGRKVALQQRRRARQRARL